MQNCARSPHRPLGLALGLAATLLACAPRAAHAPAAGGAARRHALIVTIDGLLPETYLRPDAHGLQIPTLRRFVAEGAYSEGARSVFPTVTYPAHSSIATGVEPARHGIVTNRTFDPLDKDGDAWRWYAEDLRAKPLWDAARAAGRSTALIGWPVTVGARADFVIPEFWRTHTPDDRKLVGALSTPGLLDAVEQSTPGFLARAFVEDRGDEAGVDAAIHVLRTGRPELLFLHVFQVDGAQHMQGLWSARAIAAIENADRQLARLLAALDEAGMTPVTDVVIASDHGFRDVTRQVHPRALLREAGLVRVDDRGNVLEWRAHALSSGGMAYVYLREPDDVALQATVRTLFAQKAAQPGSGVAAVLERADIAARSGDPAAFLAIEAADGAYFGWGFERWETPTVTRATHGFDPAQPDMQASLLMLGPDVKRGVLKDAHLVDVAPTVAKWLGVGLPDVDGRPLD